MTILDDNTIVVSSFTELRDAITGTNDYNYIYFDQDITLTSGISIPLSKSGLVIDGSYDGITHTYTDVDSAGYLDTLYFTGYNSTIPTMTITMQNMNMILRNYYGMIFVGDSAYATNTTIIFKNITADGTQAIYNNYGNTQLIDCTLNVGTGTRVGEVAELHNLVIGGNTTITHTTYTAYNTFYFRGGVSGSELTILPNSNVEINCARNLFSGDNIVDKMIFGANSTCVINSPYGMSLSSVARVNTFLLDTNASLTVNKTSTSGTSNLYINTSFTVNQGSVLDMRNTLGSNYQLYFYGTGATLNINDPSRFVLSNSGIYDFYFTGTTNININGRQINQWNTAPSIGDINHIPTYHWQKDDATVIALTGTATNTTTTLTTNSLTNDEILKLPDISLLQLQTLRTLSIGYLPLLSINAVDEQTIQITGRMIENSDIKVETPTETLYGTAFSDGSFAVALTNTLTEGDNVTITTSNVNYLYNTKTITVVYPGELVLYYVPGTIPFQVSNPVHTLPLRYSRNHSDWYLQVYDSRTESTSWNVLASIDQDLTSESGHVLPNSLVYVDPDENATTITSTPIVVYKGEGNTSFETITNVQWAEDEGILFEVNGVTLHGGERYTTDINWELGIEM